MAQTSENIGGCDGREGEGRGEWDPDGVGWGGGEREMVMLGMHGMLFLDPDIIVLFSASLL